MITRSQSPTLPPSSINLPIEQLFEQQTNLFEIKLASNFGLFAKDRGFGFATFCSSTISEDIFVPHRITKNILTNTPSFWTSLWAEVSCKKEGAKTKYRIENLWNELEDIITNTPKKHIKQAALSIKFLQEQKVISFEPKQKADINVHSEQLIFTYDDFLSAAKEKQLQYRLKQIGNPDKGWDRHNTIAYTYAEYFVERWANQYKLPVLDYNETNQFAPQDYNINGIDIDVKSVIGIGRRKGTQYSSSTDGYEVLIGVCTHTDQLNDDAFEMSIDGVFDPKKYHPIDLKLNYLKLNTPPNVCYFSSLYDYFLSSKDNAHTQLTINTPLIVYAANINVIPLLLKLCSKTDQEYLLKILITKQNSLLIPIISELIKKNSTALFPHYLADFIIQQTVQKQELDTTNIKYLLELITIIPPRQKRFILDLLKANETLQAVRCHWHPEETIADMGIDIYYADTSSVPTLRAICGCNPKFKTTFFTYSWKTNETLCYSSDDDICDLPNCGCLIHQYKDYHLGSVILGKSSCTKYGKNSYESWLAKREYPYQKSFVTHAN